MARPRRSRTELVLMVVVAVNLGAVVWVIGFRSSGNDTPSVLADTTPEFTLDATVVASLEGADPAPIYVLEQRARPDYRIAAFEPASGELSTVFEVPDEALAYSIATSPSGESLAVAYTADFNVDGNGILVVNLVDQSTKWVYEETPDEFVTNLAWGSDGESIWATHIAADESLSVVEIDAGTGVLLATIDDAVDPAPTAGATFYLRVDDQGARRSIGVSPLDESAAIESTISVGDGTLDLDHLVVTRSGEALFVAALNSSIETGGSSLSIGQPASAHGNHSGPSTWFRVDPSDTSPAEALPLTETIVYGAIARPDGLIAAVTREGLITIELGDLGFSETTLVESRALRAVASE